MWWNIILNWLAKLGQLILRLLKNPWFWVIILGLILALFIFLWKKSQDLVRVQKSNVENLNRGPSELATIVRYNNAELRRFEKALLDSFDIKARNLISLQHVRYERVIKEVAVPFEVEKNNYYYSSNYTNAKTARLDTNCLSLKFTSTSDSTGIFHDINQSAEFFVIEERKRVKGWFWRGLWSKDKKFESEIKVKSPCFPDSAIKVNRVIRNLNNTQR